MIVTVTATLVPATGLHEVATIRNGVTHAVKWVDIRPIGSDDRQMTVLRAMREAIGDCPNTITRDVIAPDSYSLTVEVHA